MQKKVLVADDDPVTRKLMARALEGAGYQVVVAEDGAECLHLFRKNDPHLLLIDFMMPLLDGLEVLERVRTLKARSDLPVVLITAKGSSDLVRSAVVKGINDFLTKPIKVSSLVDRISGHFFRLDEVSLREILGTLHMPDASSLSQKIQSDLSRQNLSAYPSAHGTLKLCVLTKGGKNPKALAKLPIDQIEKEISVMAKPGFIWNNIWPRKTEFQIENAGEPDAILNDEAEWRDFIA